MARRFGLACLVTSNVLGAPVTHVAFTFAPYVQEPRLGLTRWTQGGTSASLTPLTVSVDRISRKSQISRRRRTAEHGSIGASAAGDRSGAHVLATQVPAQAQVQVRTTSDESFVRLRQESYGVEAAQNDEVSPARPKAEGNCNDNDNDNGNGNGNGNGKGKGKGKGKGPELVIKGDKVTNTPQMILLVYVCIALQVSYLLQAFSMIATPWQAAWTAFGAVVGYIFADLVSGVFHWSVDNYGDGSTPVFGSVIEAFQGHHASPWTITYRPFENNVHKICYAVLPLLAFLRLINPGPAGVALGVTFLLSSLMSQEFHRYAHMTAPPPIVTILQNWGLIISRKDHGTHHISPFGEKYCIVSGTCNDALDKARVFRLVERVIFERTGIEPICWKLDPYLKEVALAGK